MADTIPSPTDPHFSVPRPGMYFGFAPDPPTPPPTPSAVVVPDGAYQVGYQQGRGYYLQKFSPFSDKLVRFMSGAAKDVLTEVDTFLTPEVAARYKKYGYAHRRGILVHGKPGTGKTSLFNQAMADFTSKGGIALYNPSPGAAHAGINLARRDGRNARVLVLLEELEGHIENWEHDLLQLLDGMASFDNFVVLASTNYLDQVPARFKCRPSRFATVVELPGPTREMRVEYMKMIVPESEREITLPPLEEIADLTEGFVLDGLKDVMVSVLCLGIPAQAAVAKAKLLQEMEAKEAKEDEEEEE